MSIINAGFIGLGNIGKPMARHLNTDTIKLTVYDVFPEAMADLVTEGALAASSPADMAKKCSYIGLCVRDDNDVESLLYGDEGILAHAEQSTLITIHSTVTQANLLRWADDAKQHGIDLIDAPMTGGANGAEAGTLCYMLGGDAAVVERCKPLLETSAGKIIHAGELGAGIGLKLCNNLITYTQFVAMSEATRLAESCGLSAEVLREVGKSNGVVNEQMYMFVSNRNALAAKADEATMEKYMGAMGRLGEKDLDCAIKTAAALDISLPATELMRSMINDVFLAKA